MNEQNKVQWVYASKNQDELAQRYDEWAGEYDADLARDFDWVGHVVTVAAFVKHVAQDAKVMDVGAGTGLAGAELAKRGFKSMDAFDLSEGMLAEARKLGVYGDVRKGVLGKTLAYETASSDAAIATGVFSVGHAPASGRDEVARIVKPGGSFACTLRPEIYEPNGFKAKEEEFAVDGKWKLVEAGEPIAMLPKGEPDIRHQIHVYQILK